MKNKDLKKVLHYFNLTLSDFSKYTGISYAGLRRLDKNALLKYDYQKQLFEFIKAKKGLTFSEQKTIIETILNFKE